MNTNLIKTNFLKSYIPVRLFYAIALLAATIQAVDNSATTQLTNILSNAVKSDDIGKNIILPYLFKWKAAHVWH